ncbi:MAG TPA: ABC transporter permease [Candidatus Pullichristensenella excrementigallinarum]|uniref:ABC transporter permease n=1 Tax=Candidatus Pullichristensenella excrementigallinarum TaxID=2840907 RepID=A0A9D1LCN4_9FIRM|nr:ABC transporter permease [Candidatus Pullichristensenella excrementigallinarum]
MNLLAYIRKRLLMLVLVLLGLSIITFTMINLTPVDPVILWGGEKASPEVLEKVRQDYGLDQPVVVQYFHYMANIFQGNFGVSLSTKHEVAADIATYFPATLELVLVAWVFALLVGVPLGILSAVKSNSIFDGLTRVVSLGGISMPLFWLGLLLQMLLFKQLGWLPLQGRLDDMVAILNPIEKHTGLYLIDSLITGNYIAFGDALKHIIMPALTLSVSGIATIMRMTRSCMLEILSKDYMVMAKTYGLSKRKVFFQYGLKNALVPIITIVSMSMCSNLMGSVVVESIFDWPGIGRYATRCILNADYSPVMAVVLMMGAIYVVINLVVDILYFMIDKRIAYDSQE